MLNITYLRLVDFFMCVFGFLVEFFLGLFSLLKTNETYVLDMHTNYFKIPVNIKCMCCRLALKKSHLKSKFRDFFSYTLLKIISMALHSVRTEV